ncbi:DnaQ-like (or DEDD) 3'-5' exonuclease superfamily protein [Metarhizium robertsii]|uniref:3'-5' exonuclease n=2 Tax=Metarhizium robertsii TaxID=568076 RepID=E9EKC7_METRA|nr:3'-5' exonuclease [Metarhizium robertsii ARSEF 23]EFZ03868.1 3'-5' exonuclease [Metarhizium robertsii ARSEF 23]EXU94939.1 DnaQ-like (or DEDD) 3'-5' exonuclease superfamily protein [Metarhizium robertsii]
MAEDMPQNTIKKMELIVGNTEALSLSDSSALHLIDTAGAISELMNNIEDLPKEPPSLYFDIEGDNLSRHGTIAILQLYVMPINATYLIDVYTLGDKCFSTPGGNGRTLKDILEFSSIPKVFFDVRNDSDALHGHFKIKLAGIQDLQLMELATRSFSKRCVNGLSKCIERDGSFTIDEKLVWMETKKKGLLLFAPEEGGSYDIFKQRPLPKDIVLYCAQDVQILPRLWSYYNRKLSKKWRTKMLDASKERVALSQSPSYNGKGPHMALSPAGWYVQCRRGRV